MSNDVLLKFVSDTTSKNHVVVFSKTWCPYCRHVKDILSRINVKYELIELDLRKDGNQIQDVMETLTGARTVPRVFIGGKFVGGGTDIAALYRAGKLETMINNRK